MARVRRLDFATSSPVSGAQRTPAGGLRVPARLTRTGVLRYRDGAGQEWGELRVPEEVFALDSLATLRGAPVTEDHQGMVTADTWRVVARGHVCEDVRPDDTFVAATVAIEDATTVAKVEAEELVEVSCGYTCDLDPSAGVYEGVPYNAIQRNIRYNHLALGPRGWGRAGADVSLRMDGAAVEIPAPQAPQRNTMKIITLGGKQYRLDADADLGAFTEALAALESRVGELGPQNTALANELTGMKDALNAALAQVSALEEKLGAHAEPDGDALPETKPAPETKTKPEADALPETKPAPETKTKPATVGEAAVPEDVKDSIAEKRIALWDKARKVLGPKADLKGKTARQIHEACVQKRLPAVKCDSLSSETLAGMFLALTEAAPGARNEGLAAAHADAAGMTGGAPVVHTEPDADAARAKMRDASVNAWKQPLGKNPTVRS